MSLAHRKLKSAGGEIYRPYPGPYNAQVDALCLLIQQERLFRVWLLAKSSPLRAEELLALATTLMQLFVTDTYGGPFRAMVVGLSEKGQLSNMSIEIRLEALSWLDDTTEFISQYQTLRSEGHDLATISVIRSLLRVMMLDEAHAELQTGRSRLDPRAVSYLEALLRASGRDWRGALAILTDCTALPGPEWLLLKCQCLVNTGGITDEEACSFLRPVPRTYVSRFSSCGLRAPGRKYVKPFALLPQGLRWELPLAWMGHILISRLYPKLDSRVRQS